MLQFESKLNDAKGDRERMLIWDEYIKQYGKMYPNNLTELKQISERAIQFLLQSNIPNAHPIYIDIIIKHCLLSDNSIQKMSDFYEHKIGRESANFYYMYARLHEIQYDYEKARSIYQEGFKSKAQPEQLLRKKFKEFEGKSLLWNIDNKRKANNTTNGVSDPKKLKKETDVGRIIIQNSTPVYFKPGSKYEAGQIWSQLIKEVPDDGKSIEERLADKFFDHVEKYERPALCKKSVMILNESMELDKSIDENQLEHSLYDSATKKDILFANKSQASNIFSANMPHIFAKKSMIDYKEMHDLFNS